MASQAYVSINCAKTKSSMLGRFVEQDGTWNLAELYRNGGQPGSQDRSTLGGITGRFGVADGYTGCPGCGNMSYVRCGACAELTCWPGGSLFECAACGIHGTVSGGIDQVKVDDYG